MNTPQPNSATPTHQRRAASAQPSPVQAAAVSPLESDIIAVGERMLGAIRAIVHAVEVPAAGPVALAHALKVDKVLASRVLKATRAEDPIASLYAMPGPEPLRTLVRSAARAGVNVERVAAAQDAIDAFETLIDAQVGDRSVLDAILSSWIPEARSEFELRRKQAAFKANSQLKGVQVDALFAACILHPSVGGDLIDIVWMHGMRGLQRVRPGVKVKFASRRVSAEPAARKALDIDLQPIVPERPPLIREFCTDPLPSIDLSINGDSVRYTLGGSSFGAGSAVDLVFADVNLAEVKRFGVKKGWFFFAEASIPAKHLQFDLLVHEDLFPGQHPGLKIHDTSFEGIADVFDPRRELDELDLSETVRPLGKGGSLRSAAAPAAMHVVARIMQAMRWNPAHYRAFRVGIDYPIYGSQVSLTFQKPAGTD